MEITINQVKNGFVSPALSDFGVIIEKNREQAKDHDSLEHTANALNISKEKWEKVIDLTIMWHNSKMLECKVCFWVVG